MAQVENPGVNVQRDQRMGKLEQLEADLTTYGTKMKKTLDDDVKTRVVWGMADPGLQRH